MHITKSLRHYEKSFLNLGSKPIYYVPVGVCIHDGIK